MVYNDDYFYITVNNIKETLLICKNNNDFFCISNECCIPWDLYTFMKITALETTLYTPTEPKDCGSIPQSELILKNIDKQNHCINTYLHRFGANFIDHVSI